MSDFRPDIWRLQANFDTQGLIEALKNADAGIRKRAAAALRALGATEALPALKVALTQEQDPETRSNIVSALAAIEIEKDRAEAPPEPAPVSYSEMDSLLQELSSPQPEKVIAAALKLGEMRDKRAVEPLVMLFNNAGVPVNVRLAIAEALLKLESAPVEVALLGALRSSKWRVRRTGAAILGQLRAEWAVEPLAKALDDENDVVRKTARAALKHIKSTEARAALAAHEKRQSHKTETSLRPPRRLQEAIAAANLPKPEAVDPLATQESKAPEAPTVTEKPAVAPPTRPLTDAPESVAKPTQPISAPKTEPNPKAAPTTPAKDSAPAEAAPVTKPVDQAEPVKPANTKPAAEPIAPVPTVVTPLAATTSPNTPRAASPIVPTNEAKFTWPKREVAPKEDPSKAVTKPLNPKHIEDADDLLKD